jgi:hypothetical protein
MGVYSAHAKTLCSDRIISDQTRACVVGTTYRQLYGRVLAIINFGRVVSQSRCPRCPFWSLCPGRFHDHGLFTALFAGNNP